MSLGKLQLVSTPLLYSEFLDSVAGELSGRAGAPQYAVSYRDSVGLLHESRCRITPSPGGVRPFVLTLNTGIHGHTLFEANPSTYSGGFRELVLLVEQIFGRDHQDFKISRIDLFADVTFPVDTLYRTLRVPYKRKGSQFTCAEADRGLTGFYVGRSPSKVRVYNKLEEMRHRRRDVAGLPQTLTRVEWEYRRDKCPVQRFSQLAELLDFRPFDPIEFIESKEIYDFHRNPKESRKLFLFNKLKQDYGLHEAYRLLNPNRNFRRDFRDLTKEVPDIQDQLHRSYKNGIEAFFGNRLSDGTFTRPASGQKGGT